jgi:hypothetical protein
MRVFISRKKKREPCQRLFPQLLMAALQRTVAFADVQHRTVLIGEDLQFDVLRILEIAFGVNRRVLEIRLGFAARGFERRLQLAVVVRDLQAFAAAAAGRLERQRIAVVFRRAARAVEVFDGRDAAGNDRHFRLLHRRARAQFVAHCVDGIRVRPNPREAGLDDSARERGVFGEEPVPRMDRFGAGTLRRLDQFVDVQVTQRRRGRTDQVGFVGHAHVQRVTVRFGIDRNGRDVHLARRSHDPNRDLAAVRN